MEARRRFLIVGGGLAGHMLAARLMQAEQRVALVDAVLPGAASTVAAGLFNVVNSRRPGKSWKADELVRELGAFFQDPLWSSLKCHARFGPIYHPFREASSLKAWREEVSNPEYSPYVELIETPMQSDKISNPFGGLMVKQGGWLDVHSFVQSLGSILQSMGMTIVRQHVTTDDINFDRKTLRLDNGSDHSFDDVIFCEGWHGAQNSLFPILPLVPNKGEILQVSIPGLHLTHPIFKKCFLVPLGNDLYICGSTYTRNFHDLSPTEEAKAEILSTLHQLTPFPAQVLNHVAGVRPSSHDWRPIADTHPSMRHVHILTGLGAHGVLLAPWLSLKLANHLVHGTALPPEIELSRFNARARRLFSHEEREKRAETTL